MSILISQQPGETIQASCYRVAGELLREHGSHDQSTHGRGGGGGKKAPTKQEQGAVEDYTGDQFQQVNGELRGQRESTKSTKRIVKQVDSFLDKSPKHEGSTIRSFTASPADFEGIAKQLDQGGEFSDAAFLSTKKTPSVTDRSSFANKAPPENHVVIRVNGKTGVDISKMSRNPGEGEVLFPRDTKFRVTSSLRTESGGLLAIVDEIGTTAESFAITNDGLTFNEQLNEASAGLWRGYP